ncbi:histidine ammonia-lyase [Bacteroidales bacterium OttesenSCG-928-I21]|nr:histidine ammonia-lyase [Bacteroidales bacterium OttesenSCG-928-I21]
MKIHYINSNKIDLSKIEEIITNEYQLELSDDAKNRIRNCREFLDNKINSTDKPIYGITTGFGSLCNTSVSSDDLGLLQENLVKSHACGMGDEVESRIVKLMMLLKIQGLSYGNSGVCVETVQRLVDFYNSNIVPVVYQLGSLGASGDLSPLAHMVLPMLGMGEVYYKNEKRDAANVLAELKIDALKLKSKEGLALLNGTQFMLAHAVDAALRCRKLFKSADISAALSIDAYLGRIDPFNENLHTIRAHKGQLETSKTIRELLHDSEIMAQEKKWVQDPYSFRCVPQVHGASKDTLRYVESVIETEMNSVTDNPTVFPDEDLILSGGNFHGQPLALVMDFLAIATAEIGSISERRVYRLISGERNLPPFLVANPGLNSGFMIPQYTAASIVSQNKQLCTPSSVDSLSSSNEQEDHVSMGANAATKLLRVVANVERIIAIECFAASQALYLREPLKTSKFLQDFLSEFRKDVNFVDNDIIMYQRMDKALKFLKEKAN